MNKPTYLFLKWFTETKFYRTVARRWLANVTFRFWGYPKFEVSNYWEIKKIINENASKIGLFIFLGADRKALSYKFEKWALNCKYGHAGFVLLGEDGEIYIYDVTHSGLRTLSLLDYLSKIDDFALGFLALTPEGVVEAKRRLEVIKNLPSEKVIYDYSLRLEPELIDYIEKGIEPSSYPFQMYCSELIYLVCEGLVLNGDIFHTHWLQDREIFEPDDVYEGSEILFEERND
jgi:hypothetical protein